MVRQAPMNEVALDKLQRDTFGYSLKETNRANGMVPDNTRQGAHASIAPIGFALAADTIGVERGFIARPEAKEPPRNNAPHSWGSMRRGSSA
jgi:hypothetical protein